MPMVVTRSGSTLFSMYSTYIFALATLFLIFVAQSMFRYVVTIAQAPYQDSSHAHVHMEGCQVYQE